MLPLLQTVLTTTAESLNDFAGQAGWTQALFATLFDPAWNQDNAHVIWPAVLFVHGAKPPRVSYERSIAAARADIRRRRGNGGGISTAT